MKIARFLLAALTLFLAVSCGDDTQTVTVKHYSLTLPTFLTVTKGLNDAASLQYQNAGREFYVLVIDEPRKTFEDLLKENALGYEPNLDGYSGLLIESLVEGSGAKEKPAVTAKKINGLDARVTSVKGEVSGEKVFWKIAYVEGKNTYYQVLCWTSQAKQDEYEPQIDAILESFKEADKTREK